MNTLTAPQLEEQIKQLPLPDQLWLLEQMIHSIRKNADKISDNPPEKSTNISFSSGNTNQGTVRSATPAQTAEVEVKPEPSLQESILPFTNKPLLKATFAEFMRAEGIENVEPIGAEALQALIRREAKLEQNELSQGIIEMREEKRRAPGLS